MLYRGETLGNKVMRIEFSWHEGISEKQGQILGAGTRVNIRDVRNGTTKGRL